MPDQAPLTTQVVAPFGQGELPSPPISIEGDPGVYSDDDIHLLLLCPTTATVRTNAGSVALGSSKPVDVPGGIIQFSGSRNGSLPSVPFFKGTELKVLFAFDETGVGISVNVKYIPQQYTVEASRPFYGAVSYTPYQARGFVLTYTPQLAESSGGGSIKQVYGVIAAFAPPHSITTYQVQPATLNTGAVEMEIYRRVSKSVTTKDGEFERPPNFPTDGTYPDSPLVLDTSTALETERVHEIGFIDPVTGYCRVNPYFVPIRNPYQSKPGYAPKFECIVSNLPNDMDAALLAKAKAFIKSRNYGCKE